MFVDAASNRKMLAMMLSKQGIKSAQAEDGQLGVDAVRDNPGRFDLIFMDFTMPVMVAHLYL
jgi:CheY-like chemotaxis protein